MIVRHYPGCERLSGLVALARELARSLAERCTLTVHSGDGSSGAEANGINIQPVRPPFWWRVWKEVRDIRPDAVIVMSGIHRPNLLYPLAFRARSAKLVQERLLFVQAVTLDREFGANTADAMRRLGKVATLNPAQGRRLQKVLPDIEVLSPGVSFARLQAGGVWPRKSRFRIGFFGHMNQIKGADRMIDILGRLPRHGWDCLICGIGKLERDIRDIARDMDNVEVHGYLPDPLPALRSCDVLVAPFRQSATVLGISQVVLESLACGIPVIGSRVEAVAEAVRDGIDGFLREDNDGMAQEIRRLMVSPALLAQLSGNASARARDFSIDRLAERMLTITGCITSGSRSI